MLEDQDPNSRSVRRIRITSVEDAAERAETVRAYIHEAIEVEEAGLKVALHPGPSWSTNLRDRLDADLAFKAAFEALTPGRQREYNQYFSEARQAATCAAHVEKYARNILGCKGFRNR